MTVISGEAALAEFRGRLTGRHGLDLLDRHGGSVLVQLPVGVGKSRWIDAITLEAVRGGVYDLVVVLCPTRQLIEERGPLQNPPPGVRVVNLRPRPADRCGPERDARWLRLEAADLGALGRVEVCGRCPLRRQCFWPGQYGRGLRGAQIIYAAQAHLERSPDFLLRLGLWSGARRVLTLLAEASFVGVSRERRIARADLDRFADALRGAARRAGVHGHDHQRWLEFAGMLRDASGVDLQAAAWQAPPINPRWAAAVQAAGLHEHGDSFRFPGHDLTLFCSSPVESRRKADNGDVHFSVRPAVGDCVVFSGTADRDFARFRLGKELASPFAGWRFVHPDTRWYNLASPIGSRRFFGRHAPQVLDFFAELTGRRLREGKRVLLVAKKCFVPTCREGLQSRLDGRGPGVRLVTEGWSPGLLAEAGVVPLINYGMIGTNLFESFDAVYCLTGYYVNERVVNQCLQDVTRQDLRLPIEITTDGNPRRRRAVLQNPEHRYYETARLAQPALEFQEHDVVVQAVGRVRPFTRPREVVTFQTAELPGVAYDAEFQTLAEARRFFGVACGGRRRKDERAARIAGLRAQGLSQAETARRLGVTERTVRNYEIRRKPEKSHLRIYINGNFPVARPCRS